LPRGLRRPILVKTIRHLLKRAVLPLSKRKVATQPLTRVIPSLEKEVLAKQAENDSLKILIYVLVKSLIFNLGKTNYPF
jgi:hypothetical protein